jgi:hypothetical protein
MHLWKVALHKEAALESAIKALEWVWAAIDPSLGIELKGSVNASIS